MATMLELDQLKAEELEKPVASRSKAPPAELASPSLPDQTFQRALFSGSLLDSDSPERRRRRVAADALICVPMRARWNSADCALDVHGSIAKSTVAHIPGSATASFPTPSAGGCACRKSGPNRHAQQWRVANSNTNPEEG